MWMCACVHVCVCACACVRVSMCVCVCVCVYEWSLPLKRSELLLIVTHGGDWATFDSDHSLPALTCFLTKWTGTATWKYPRVVCSVLCISVLQVFLGIGQFIVVITASVVIGILVGMVAAFITRFSEHVHGKWSSVFRYHKWARWLQHLVTVLQNGGLKTWIVIHGGVLHIDFAIGFFKWSNLYICKTTVDVLEVGIFLCWVEDLHKMLIGMYCHRIEPILWQSTSSWDHVLPTMKPSYIL